MGALNTGEFKNYGLNLDTDRCFGSLASNSTGDMFYGMRFQNDTIMSIAALQITYTGEQWRTAGTVPGSLTFSYRVSPFDITDLTTGTYTNFPALNFTTPTNTTPPAALNGNLPANRVTVTAVLPVSVPPLQEIMIRWTDNNDPSTDQGACIDDVTVTASATTTAADVSIGGRVRTADGRGIGRVTVVLSGSLAEPMVALTNPFGYYRFDGVPSGESYVLSVRSKVHRFETSSIFINVGDEMTDLDFIAVP